jgi:hypothetical protein
MMAGTGAARLRPPQLGRGCALLRGPFPMDTDRNLLFGVLALQADLIDNDKRSPAATATATPWPSLPKQIRQVQPS